MIKIAIFLSIFSISIFSQQYWVKSTGTRDFIQDIFIDPTNTDNVVVCSDRVQINRAFDDMFPSVFDFAQGVGVQISRNAGSDFTEFKFVDSTVGLKVIQSPNNTSDWILSSFINNRSRFYKSSDFGNTWERIETNCDESLAKIFDMTSSGDRIIGGAASVANGLFTIDGEFESCVQSTSLQVSIREIKNQNGKIWLAADDFANNGVYFSEDNGDTWNRNNQGIEGLRVHTLDVSEVYEEYNLVYCGGDEIEINQREGRGIYVSRNGGLSFSQQTLDGVVVYDIEHHPLYPEFMVAACGTDGVYISADGGSSWSSVYNSGLPEEVDVRIVNIPAKELIQNGYEVYLGTYGEGMYYSQGIQPTLTDIEESGIVEKFAIVSLYPNPTNDKINIDLNQLVKSLDLSIMDINGKELFSSNYQLNDRFLSIDLPTNINDGFYILNINADGRNISESIVVK